VENFTNPVIDTSSLPRYEEVEFTKLHSGYWKVLMLSAATVFLILGIVITLALIFIEELTPSAIPIVVGFLLIIIISVICSRVSFLKKAYAFRNHDVLLRSGILATKTTIIPYNRVQHVALHEGMYSRMLGFASIEVFTAGGSSSDITIPGLKKDHAEDIKQLLMGKIQKQL